MSAFADRRILLLLAVFSFSCSKWCSFEPENFQRVVVDTHIHASPTEIERLHSIMDEVGITWGLNLSGSWPGAGLDKQIAAAKASGRLIVATNLPWFMASKDPNFPSACAFLLQKAKEAGARALKVEKGLGLGAIKYSGGYLAVDDPWLDPIWKTAGELGLPVVIHTGDPKAFWLPVDEKNERFEELSAHPGWSNYGVPDLPTFEQLLTQFINVVKKHPSTTFVGVHFGNNAEDPFWVAEQLEKYPNLYVDIAARLPEFGRHDPKRMHDLFVKYADRILFATDLGVSAREGLMLGSFGKERNRREEVGPFFAAHWRYFETWDEMPSPTPIQGRWNIRGVKLPREVLEKIYHKNAEKLFGKPQL